MTLICKETKSVFYHIQKTGGSSIRNYILRHSPYEFIRHPKNEDPHHFIDQHETPTDIRWFQRQNEVPKNLGFSWCIVRNPYDRLVSLYHAWKQHGDTPDFVANSDFETWCYNYHLGHYERFQHEYALHVDKYYKFEQGLRHLKKFIDRKYAIDTDEPLPKINTSEHVTWPDYYDKELCDFIYNFYLADFKFLGYEKYHK